MHTALERFIRVSMPVNHESGQPDSWIASTSGSCSRDDTCAQSEIWFDIPDAPCIICSHGTIRDGRRGPPRCRTVYGEGGGDDISDLKCPTSHPPQSHPPPSPTHKRRRQPVAA